MCRLPVSAVLACAVAWASASAPPVRAAPPEPLATQEDIQQHYNEGKHAAVLQKLQRVLLLKGAAASPYDRHALLRLKGESHLRSKQNGPAAQAFNDAAGEAADPTAKAIDLSTEFLIKRAPALTYTGKAKERAKEGPIDILDAASRKRAFAALFEDERAAAEPKVRAARDSKQLTKIIDVLPVVRGVRSLELASAGRTWETDKMLGDLSAHAQALIAEALKVMARTTDEIEKSANEWIAYDEVTRDPNSRTGTRTDRRWRRRGFDKRDQKVLQETQANCERLAPACRDLTEALGSGDKEFAAIRTETEKVGRKASAVLNDDYKRTAARPPK